MNPVMPCRASQANRDHSEHLSERGQCGAQRELRSARFNEKHREPEGCGIRVPFLLVTFLWACKEKYTRAQERGNHIKKPGI